MGDRTVIHVGVDDTDSPRGMCTTFLAYKIVGMLRDRGDTELLDLPRLIRLNPNIPWKTRGNGAVSLKIATGDPPGTKRRIRGLVSRYSDTGHGANPGLVFLEGDAVPAEFASFSRLALWQLVSRQSARRLARGGGWRRLEYFYRGNGQGLVGGDASASASGKGSNGGLEYFYRGNGQGLVGAIGAIGYDLSGDHTLELLSYRKRHRFGTRREISAASVRAMQDRTFPNTFGSVDPGGGRVLIAPRGPDPVFYGIRGEDVGSLVAAAGILESDEEPDGYMVFRSNQATGDHLRNELTPQAMRPYASGWVAGTVSEAPRTVRGGHVLFGIERPAPPPPAPPAGCSIRCAVYRPTGMSVAASRLMVGDRIRVGGGVRRASKNFPRVINVEFIDVVHTARNLVLANPPCGACGKRMKSKGVSQGFECIRCGTRSPSKTPVEIPRRGIRKRLYVPRASAHRHLTRPPQRMGVANRPADVPFDASAPWFRVYVSDSGE